LHALADAVGKPNQFLLAFGGGTDDHEHAPLHAVTNFRA
jgi:hypothetical protein